MSTHVRFEPFTGEEDTIEVGDTFVCVLCEQDKPVAAAADSPPTTCADCFDEISAALYEERPPMLLREVC